MDCWGTNTSGALGNGSTTLPQADVPVAVTGISDATNGGTNNAFTYCMLLSSESVRCWGDNTDGQLGDGTSVASSNVPVGVLGVFKPVGLASDGTSFCAQLKSGGAQCWGSNADGALGDGSTAASSSVPVAVRGLNYIQKLFGRAGGYCVVIDGGGVKCWGSNANGSLGDGKTSGYSAVPVAVKGLSGVSSIDGSCALLGNGKVKCWGSGVDGDLGNGTSGTPSDVAVPGEGADRRCPARRGLLRVAGKRGRRVLGEQRQRRGARQWQQRGVFGRCRAGKGNCRCRRASCTTLPAAAVTAPCWALPGGSSAGETTMTASWATGERSRAHRSP